MAEQARQPVPGWECISIVFQGRCRSSWKPKLNYCCGCWVGSASKDLCASMKKRRIGFCKINEAKIPHNQTGNVHIRLFYVEKITDKFQGCSNTASIG